MSDPLGELARVQATERIAVALLGYKPDPDGRHGVEGNRGYWGPNQEYLVFLCEKNCCLGGPNFSTLDGCRLFEDALIQRDGAIFHVYVLHLIDIWMDQLGPNQPKGWREQKWIVGIRSTPAARVAACIRLLDELEAQS